MKGLISGPASHRCMRVKVQAVGLNIYLVFKGTSLLETHSVQQAEEIKIKT